MLLVLWTGGMATYAQEGYNPENPPEPSEMFNVQVSVYPAEAGFASGGGRFAPGVTTTLQTSAQNGYVFRYWKLNGEIISQDAEFEYTVTNHKAVIVAVYDYAPESPDDPTGVMKYRLFLTSNLTGACSFNIVSGQKHEIEEWVKLEAKFTNGFDFLGWYNKESCVSESPSFNYLMSENNDVTLEARVRYNPQNPEEPGKIEVLLGDVNQDGAVDMVDVVALTNIYLGKTIEYDIKVCDINQDGIVDMVDVVAATNIYLGK